jgi:glutamine cyclotransferase
MRTLFSAFILSMTLLSCADASVKTYKLEVVAEYPHDTESYTQGLFFHEGELYESTGTYGKSTFRKNEMDSGKALKRLNFDNKYFVEGSTVLGDNLYVLTWESRLAFVYDAKTLEYKSSWKYPREGWGLTTDGNRLIASDGSAYIYFLDAGMNAKSRIQVKAGSHVVPWLNELEYIDGKIWANVYTSDEIAIIDPSSGHVEGVIDCRGLLPKELHTYETDVLNGIAYNPHTKKIYLTGKNWPELYEVRLIEK